MSDIFKSTTLKTKNNSIMSFKDCPNGCIDGYYINPYIHKRVECDYCKAKRKELVSTQLRDETTDETICEMLRLQPTLQGYAFDINTVFPDLTDYTRDEESLELVRTELTNLMNKISVGDVPEYSVMFNLGIKARENNFIYPYMMRAYMEGVSVAPFLSSYDVLKMRLSQEQNLDKDSDDISYNDLLSFDLCVLRIETGATIASILSVGALMELRAMRGKSTLIFTNDRNKYFYKFADKNIFDKKIAKYCEVVVNDMSDDNFDASGLSTNDFEALLKSKDYI